MLIGTVGNNIVINTLAAGDALSFEFGNSSYPASLWFLNFALSLNGNKILNKQATASGDNFNVALIPADTITLRPGRCQAWLIFTEQSDATQRFSLPVGLLTILPNPLGNIALTENMLSFQAIQRTISIIVSQPESSANFNGQSYSMHNLNDLYAIRDRLKVAVDLELQELGIPTRGSGFKTIRTRFV